MRWLQKKIEQGTPIILLLLILVTATGTFHTMAGFKPEIMNNWITPWFPFLGMKTVSLLLVPQLLLLLHSERKRAHFTMLLGLTLLILGFLFSSILIVPYYFHAVSITLFLGILFWKKHNITFPLRHLVIIIVTGIMYGILFMHISPSVRLILSELYTRFHLEIMLLILYGVAWVKLFQTSSPVILHIATIFHLTLLLVRGLIEQQYPVTSLHETFLFGGFIATVIAWFQNETAIRRGGVTVTILLLLISLIFSDGAGNFRNDAPFLDKKIWLIVHVTSILIGMISLLWAAVLGHFQVVKTILTETTNETTVGKMNNAMETALLFMIIGTVLGALWGFESWGRFWGWDPKENGALLILLWLTFSLWGKERNLWKSYGNAVTASLSLIFLVFTWIGVNMNSASIHSYGYSFSGAIVLFLFLLFEFLYLTLICVAPFLPSRHI